MTNTASLAPAHCRRCGRELTAQKSRELGYGPVCARKMREAASQLANFVKAYQVEKAVEVIELGAAQRIGRTPQFVVVASNGRDCYDVNLHNRTCTCKAGERGIACYHLAAARILAA